jgi:transcriptional regulator GlxA family with amidase domain
LSRTRLRAVLDHIQEHLSDELRLARLAEVAAMDRHHFGRAFKSATGQSPHRYVNAQRIARAAQLLARSDLPIAVTCVIPATSDPAHMTEYLGAMRGELPDQAVRDRMVEHMKTIPGFDGIAQMPWYNGRRFDGAVQLSPGQAIG